MIDDRLAEVACLERLCRVPCADRLEFAPASDGLLRLEACLAAHTYRPHRHDTYAIGITLAGVQRYNYRKSRGLEGGRMLRKRKKPKRKSIALTLMRDVQGSAAEKLRMFEKVRAARGFAREHPADLAKAEKMLREF